jgi:hypothetical protein
MPSQFRRAPPSPPLSKRSDRLAVRGAYRWLRRRAATGRPGRALRLLGLCLLLAPDADALPLTFDAGEIGGSALPVNGLPAVMGATFHFTIGGSDSNAAVYGATPSELVGDVTDFVKPGVLEGDSQGILAVQFGGPATSFSFDLAMDESFATQSNPIKGFDIELLDEFGASLGPPTDVMIFIQPTGGNLWAETQYSYTGGDAVTTAVLDFNEGTFPDRTVFWLDNLDFVVVPEPGTFLMLVSALVGLGVFSRIRRL